MKPILEIQDLSKCFQISKPGLSYLSFRDKISGMFKPEEAKENFWALKDVSFSVQPGESVGIIGKNGAGKSTLLKILSRITPPTKGQIVCRGRISSLLEVGTGFHQELTGRENIFMNGSIMGMKRAEINRQFDEIVVFSGVEKFLDTPLKHYSSGMQLRLAFAVAAHLEPEILIIDEVLAVGDASFQRKCFQRMENINAQGRTILFVSHNMTQVNTLCKTGVLLDQGGLVFRGDIQHTISAYLNSNMRNSYVDIDLLPRAGIKAEDLRIKTLRLHNTGKGLEMMEGNNLAFELGFEARNTIEELVMGFSLTDFYGNNIVECRSTSSFKKMRIERGQYKIQVNFDLNLAAGSYNLNLGARSEKGHLEYIPSVLTLEILPSKNGFEEWNKPSAGIVATESEWKLENAE